MAKIKYSTYVTVSLSFKEKVWEQGYSLGARILFSRTSTFAAQNNSHFPGTEKMPGQIGVAYCPLGEKHHDAPAITCSTPRTRRSSSASKPIWRDSAGFRRQT